MCFTYFHRQGSSIHLLVYFLCAIYGEYREVPEISNFRSYFADVGSYSVLICRLLIQSKQLCPYLSIVLTTTHKTLYKWWADSTHLEGINWYLWALWRGTEHIHCEMTLIHTKTKKLHCQRCMSEKINTNMDRSTRCRRVMGATPVVWLYWGQFLICQRHCL